MGHGWERGSGRRTRTFPACKLLSTTFPCSSVQPLGYLCWRPCPLPLSVKCGYGSFCPCPRKSGTETQKGSRVGTPVLGSPRPFPGSRGGSPGLSRDSGQRQGTKRRQRKEEASGNKSGTMCELPQPLPTHDKLPPTHPTPTTACRYFPGEPSRHRAPRAFTGQVGGGSHQHLSLEKFPEPQRKRCSAGRSLTVHRHLGQGDPLLPEGTADPQKFHPRASLVGSPPQGAGLPVTPFSFSCPMLASAV